MEQYDFETAYDVFSCIVPHGKKLYSIPMDVMTPKLAAKLAAIPDSVYVAKCDRILESHLAITFERYLLKFGELTFEGFANPEMKVGSVGQKEFLVCFTPRVATVLSMDSQHVVLDILGMTPVLAGEPNNYIGTDEDGIDYDTLGKEQQQLDREIAAFEATT
jgi:hypothetical protein